MTFIMKFGFARIKEIQLLCVFFKQNKNAGRDVIGRKCNLSLYISDVMKHIRI